MSTGAPIFDNYDEYAVNEPTFDDGCTGGCAGCFSGVFMDEFSKYIIYLTNNSNLYPNLFSFQGTGLIGAYTTHDIFTITPNSEFNYTVAGAQGSYYRIFQQKEETSFSVYTATDYYSTLNFGLFRGNTLQMGLGIFRDLNSYDSFAAFVLAYTVYFNDYKSYLKLNYK
jgi:hypothetical protein